MNDVSITELAPLRRFKRIVVLTGAGVSRASGLPTYRGDDGTWTDADARRASEASAITDDLAAVWRLWGGVAHRAAGAEPNAAHHALAEAEESVRTRQGSLLVVTQNVDGLHQRGGQRDVVELHGSTHRQQCLSAACGAVAPFGGTGESVPACAECGGPTRPGIVLFGEPLDMRALERAWEAVRDCDLLLAAGTSCTVSPAADLVGVARYSSALCVALTREPLSGAAAFHAAATGLAEHELPRWVTESR